MKKLISALLSLSLVLSLSALPASAITVDEVRQLLREHYVDTIPEEVLALGSVDEILDALNDPYTVYMTKEEYEAFLTSVDGEVVVGIGVSIENAFNNGFQILSVLPKSPALEAGLEAGDRIVAVDGVELTAGMDVRAAVTGEEGTKVTITVIRRSDGSRKEYTLTRRPVSIPIVTYEADGNVGYIDCTSFGASTVETIEEALTGLNDKVDVWVLDLRANPGGTVQAAAGSSGLFAGSGLVMIYLRDAAGEYQYYYTTAFASDLTDKPLIVLTSPYSASGSEMFAGDARDHGFGIGLGQRTFGKGIAQTVYDERNYPDLFDGDALKITTDRFFSPNGTTNHLVGVLPTLLISDENTPLAAELLTCPAPVRPSNHLRLELGGFTFYVDVAKALTPEYRAAFTELVEALPPAVQVSYSTGQSWDRAAVLSAPELAARLKLDYSCRYSFSDVEGIPEQVDIETLAVYNLLSGYDDGSFKPDAPVTRAEFCAMLAAALAFPATESTDVFSDVAAGDWYAAPVAAMYNRGFIAGFGDGTFRPEATITYQEAVTILSSAAAWLSMEGYDLAKEEIPVTQWPDYYQFSEWAQAPAWRLGQLGVKLDLSQPKALADRAQSASLVCQLMRSCGLFWGDF